MANRVDLNHLDVLILAALRRASAAVPVQLVRHDIEVRTRRVTPARSVLNALTRLRRKGFVAVESERRDGSGRHLFALTPQGSLALEAATWRLEDATSLVRMVLGGK